MTDEDTKRQAWLDAKQPTMPAPDDTDTHGQGGFVPVPVTPQGNVATKG